MSGRWIAPEPQVTPFVVDRSDDEVVLSLFGEIDIANLEELERHLDAIAFSLPPRVIVDFEDLEFIDGATAGAIVATAQALEPFGTSVVLRSARPAVRRVLDFIAAGAVAIEP